MSQRKNIFLVILFITLVPISIFFDRDIAHFVSYIHSDFVRFILGWIPLLIGLSASLFLLRATRGYLTQTRAISHWFKSLSFVFFALILGLSLVFSSQIRTVREVIDFRFHEQEYSQLIILGQKIRDTPSLSPNCAKYIKLPSPLNSTLGHQMIYVFDYQNTHWIGFVQDINEREIDLFYISGNLPSIGVMEQQCESPVECYYKIDEHWYLCTEYKSDF